MRALIAAVFALGFAPQQAGPPSVVPVRPGDGIISPVVLASPSPKYTRQALEAKIEGTVVVEAVVLQNGLVGDVRVTKSLDQALGLDEQAVLTAQQWKFIPGTDRTGKPVPVVVTLELGFHLHGREQSQPSGVRAPVISELPQDFLQDARVLGSPGVTAPSVLGRVEPKYTAAAMLAKIQGSVDVDVVVAPDGTVARARIARGLDSVNGLDGNALTAVRQWQFRPGAQSGQPVPVVVRVTLEFRLH